MKESIWLKIPGVPKGKWHYGIAILKDGKMVVVKIYNKPSGFCEVNPEVWDKKRIVTDLYKATKHWLKTHREKKRRG